MMKWRRILSLLLLVCLVFINNGITTYAKENESYVGRISQFTYQHGMMTYDGYGYLQGIEIANKADVTHRIKFVDSTTGKQVLTFKLNHFYSEAVTTSPQHGNNQYNYNWAKFKGEFDLGQLPVGTYNIKVYINAKNNKYEEIIPFHSSINSFSLRIENKNYQFDRVKKNGINTLELTVTQETEDEDIHIKRISNLYGTSNGLFVDGYSYIKYTNIPSKKDIIQKLKFIDVSSGKQVKTYTLPNFKSDAVTNDSNHGAGIYNYDWAKFKGTITTNDLPIGEYYLKIYTNAKSQKFDEIINVHSSISDFSYEAADKEFMFTRVNVNGINTLKVTVVSKPNQKHVVLDPGHGGKDSGAVGAGFYEKDLNLDIAKAAAQYLVSKGVKVTMTRDSDVTMELKERSSFVNSINPDLTVSIHNDANIEGANGAHVIYSLHDKNGGPTKTLAQNILNSVVKNTTQEASSKGIWYRLHPDNPNDDYYHIIREIKTPAVIIECAFMNSADITSLEAEDGIVPYAVDTPNKRESMGIAIAKGILKTLGLSE